MFTSTASTPHAKYTENLKKAELDKSAMGLAWLNAAARSLTQPLAISLPYTETGYFDAVKNSAAGYTFSLRRGEMLQVTLTKKPAIGFNLFLELWKINDGTQPDLEEALATDQLQLKMEVKKEGKYLLRLQPELLGSGEYTLLIQTGPSLAFPVIEKANPRISGLWGDKRDGGVRSHEGIDIFAAKRSPLIAAAKGTITSVTTNNLGGKVIFLRAADRNYSLYYAHLDSQMVSQGQRVDEGEVIGLMGNTGNASSTSPHLHFGVYTNSGPIDPLPFVEKKSLTPPSITVSIQNLNDDIKSMADTKIYSSIGKNPVPLGNIKAHTLMKVHAATSSYYKIILPDGTEGFIPGSAVASIEKGIQTVNISKSTALLDKPDLSAASKTILKNGDKVIVVAKFNDFLFVKAGNENGWIR